MTTTVFCTVERVTSAGRLTRRAESIWRVHEMPNKYVAGFVCLGPQQREVEVLLGGVCSVAQGHEGDQGLAKVGGRVDARVDAEPRLDLGAAGMVEANDGDEGNRGRAAGRRVGRRQAGHRLRLGPVAEAAVVVAGHACGASRGDVEVLGVEDCARLCLWLIHAPG